MISRYLKITIYKRKTKKAHKVCTAAELGEYLGQIKSYAEALEVMDDEHDDTLLANCMDVHNIKEI